MKKYKIQFGTGSYISEERVVEVEDFENEQDALDKMIDQLEEEGSEGYFLELEETTEEGGDRYPDEYIIGGNNGKILYHGGNLRITELNKRRI